MQHEYKNNNNNVLKMRKRFEKKFTSGKEYIFDTVFPWLTPDTPLEQIAILITSSNEVAIKSPFFMTLGRDIDSV